MCFDKSVSHTRNNKIRIAVTITLAGFLSAARLRFMLSNSVYLCGLKSIRWRHKSESDGADGGNYAPGGGALIKAYRL